jgi:hypothetical protein
MKKQRCLSDCFGRELNGFWLEEVCYLQEPDGVRSPQVNVICLGRGENAPVVFFPEKLLYGIPVGPKFRNWRLRKGRALVNPKTGEVFWLNGFQSTEKYPSRMAGLWVTPSLLKAWQGRKRRPSLVPDLRGVENLDWHG